MSRALPRHVVHRTKLLSVLVALACVAVGAVGLRVSDAGDEFSVVKAQVGKPVGLNEGRVVVDAARVGTALSSRGEVSARTTGMFVVVQVTLSNPDAAETVRVNQAELLTATHTYASYSSSPVMSAAPGYAETVDLRFEVDPAQIDGLTLQIWSSGFLVGYHERLRVQLGITGDNAEQWRAAAREQVVDVEPYGTTAVIP